MLNVQPASAAASAQVNSADRVAHASVLAVENTIKFRADAEVIASTQAARATQTPRLTCAGKLDTVASPFPLLAARKFQCA